MTTETYRGMPCLPCHSEQMIIDLDINMPPCGTEMMGYEMRVVDPDFDLGNPADRYCMDPYNPVCVGYKKTCKGFCAGGNQPPVSKRWFFSDGWLRKYPRVISATEKYLEGPMKDEYAELTEWTIELCFPIDACKGRDKCIRSHVGRFCAECKFKYYRENQSTGRCV